MALRGFTSGCIEEEVRGSFIDIERCEMSESSSNRTEVTSRSGVEDRNREYSNTVFNISSGTETTIMLLTFYRQERVIVKHC